jgi:predicted PurR-regulated permease PerM
MASISKFFGALIGIIVVASLLAFLLNYPVNWCVEHNLKREPASIIIFLLALSVLLGLGITLFPLAYAQVQQLAVRLPEWIESGRQQLIVLGLEFKLGCHNGPNYGSVAGPDPVSYQELGQSDPRDCQQLI